MLPDLESALTSFQAALRAGELQLRRGTLDPEVFVHLDEPNGELRLTYVRLDGKTVTAFATFIQCDPVEGALLQRWLGGACKSSRERPCGRCFQICRQRIAAWPCSPRRNRLLCRRIVDVNNKASQKVAERVISSPVTTAPDSTAGVPIIQYLRRIDAGTDV